MKPVRVLQVVQGLHCGGTEMVIMNWLRHIDLEKIRFDFALYTLEDNFFAPEAQRLKARIFTITPSQFNSRKTAWQLAYNLYRLIRQEGPFQAMHTHEEQPFVAGLELLAAWCARVPKRLTISHVDRNIYEYGVKINPLKLFLGRLLIRLFSTQRLAVSQAAGRAMYGNKISFQMIHNGIDVEKFAYNPATRQKIRRQLGLSDDTVVLGTVGRLTEQKNSLFSLAIFNEFQKIRPNSKLLMIGKGPLREKIIKQVHALGLYEKLILLNDIDNVYDYYQAMDFFIFPSLFEGLGIVLVEAQASGLACVAADTVPHEAFVCNVRALSLQDSPANWAQNIHACMQNFVRKDETQNIKKAGFDAADVGPFIQAIYLK